MRLTNRRLFIRFLERLTWAPRADEVCHGLATSAMAHYGAVGAVLYLVNSDRDQLVMDGSWGLYLETLAHVHSVPVSYLLPITAAFRSVKPNAVTLTEAVQKYPLLSGVLPDSTHSQFVITFPLTYGGVPFGAVSVFLLEPREMLDPDWEFIDGVSAALSLWGWLRLREQDRLSAAGPAAPGRSLGLSSRQVKILWMLSEGASNRQIAWELGFSTATVKTDVQDMMRRLTATGRDDLVGRARASGMLHDRRVPRGSNLEADPEADLGAGPEADLGAGPESGPEADPEAGPEGAAA